MDKIIKFINQNTNNKYPNLLFFGATLDMYTSTMQLKFSFNDKTQKIKENEEEIEILCKKYLGNYVKKIETKFQSNSLTMQAFKSLIFEKLKKELNFSEAETERIKFDYFNDKTLVKISYQDGAFNEENLKDIKVQIEYDLYEETKQPVQLEFVKEEIKNLNVLENRRAQALENSYIFEEMAKSQVVDLKNIEVLWGKFQSSSAYLAGTNLSTVIEDEITLVGSVKSCLIKDMKSKVETPDENEKTNQRKYMIIELENDGETTKCVWFLSKDNNEQKEFTLDSTLAISGKINQYNGNISLRVSGIASCTFNPPEKIWRKTPTDYRYVRPEPYEFTEQTNLFFEEKKTDKKYLLENTFVVYDLETTGINPEVCKIIDIGAFKIVNGKIVEKFCTFVNPQCEIPEEASKVNRITNQLVENSPTIEMALPDFYKFCEGSIIVGYNNIGFDDLFINKESKKQFYNFNNKRDDVFNIAKSKLPGLRNYKLSTVCQAENVPLIDAHRAANDALATAKLFIKLVEKYY